MMFNGIKKRLVLSCLLVLHPGFLLAYPYVEPYYDCRSDPESGEEVCTYVTIGGCTQKGKNFAEYATCEDVRNQGRPYYPLPPVALTSPDDPRLEDKGFMQELAWVTSEISSCGCVCCHSNATGVKASNWDISDPLIWTDHMTNRGIAIMSGAVSSASQGQIPPDQNNGFDRSQTGAPTTQVERMKAFFDAELERRGVTQEEIDHMRPF